MPSCWGAFSHGGAIGSPSRLKIRRPKTKAVKQKRRGRR